MTSAFSTIMREFYRCQSQTKRPRVLAISTVSAVDLLKPAVEHNLYVKFPSQRGKDRHSGHVTTLVKRDWNAATADDEYLFYPVPTTMLHTTSSFSDVDVLVCELGRTGFSCYQSLFVCREMASLNKTGMKMSRIKGTSSVRGLTPKAILLIDFLRQAYAASSEVEKLSVIVHAGQPVVAVALHAVLSTLPCLCRTSEPSRSG